MSRDLAESSVPLAFNRPRLIACLLTYRRPFLLREFLARLSEQPRQPDLLLVVDNENSTSIRELVEGWGISNKSSVEYLGTSENLGSAGGWAVGMRRALEVADDRDWIMPLDDDDPPRTPCELRRIFEFAEAMRAQLGNKLGGVGIVGARFDWRRGTLRRLRDDELTGEVEVDVLGSGHLPLYSAAAVRRVGVFEEKLFFGYTEVEYGLRMRQADYRLLACGELWRARRTNPSPKSHADPRVTWAHYYVVRNRIWLMRRYGRGGLAAAIAMYHCLLHPWRVAFRSPRQACRRASYALRAARDGFLGRMGRRLDPDSTSW